MLPVVVGLLLIGGFFAYKSDAFLTSRNLTNLILQMAGISSVTKFIVIGTILVISVSIDAVTRNRRRAAGRL